MHYWLITGEERIDVPYGLLRCCRLGGQYCILRKCCNPGWVEHSFLHVHDATELFYRYYCVRNAASGCCPNGKFCRSPASAEVGAAAKGATIGDVAWKVTVGFAVICVTDLLIRFMLWISLRYFWSRFWTIRVDFSEFTQMLNTTLPDAEFTVHLTQIADIYLVDSTLYSLYSNPNAVVNTFFIPSNSMLWDGQFFLYIFWNFWTWVRPHLQSSPQVVYISVEEMGTNDQFGFGGIPCT